MSDRDLLDQLQECEGCALISDDFGNWAVSHSGMQNIPENPGEPSYIAATFFVEADEWKPSVREALEAYFSEPPND